MLLGRAEGKVPFKNWDAAAAQELLGDPNPLSPAQADAFALFQNNMHEYRKRVRAQAAHFPPPV
jgi:hypothetical protein